MTEKKSKVEDKLDSVGTPTSVEKKVVEKKVTEAEKIWNEISNVQLEMFSLPDQTVRKYCTPVTIEPSKLYITASVQAVVPALENAIGKKFDIEMATKYIIISRKKG